MWQLSLLPLWRHRRRSAIFRPSSYREFLSRRVRVSLRFDTYKLPWIKKKYIKIIIKITLETASIYGKNNLVTMSKYLLNPCQRPSLKAKNTYRQEKSWTNKKGLEVKLVRRCFFTNTIPDFISWFHHDKNIFLKSFKLIFNS